jgi:hypothetical protein
MKTKLFVFLLLGLSVQAVYSQESASYFTIGPKAGINYSTLIKDNRDIDAKYKLGYTIGAFARFGKSVYIQPEVLFTTKNAQININQSDNSSAQSGSYTVKFKNIDVPVLLGVKLIGAENFNLRAYAGPMASFNIEGKGLEGLTSENQSGSDYYKAAVWGYQAGAGIDFGAVTLDARYEGGFTEAANLERANLGKPKTGLFQFSLGIKLL